MNIGIDIGSETIKTAIVNQNTIQKLKPVFIAGQPLHKLKETILKIKSLLKDESFNGVRIGFTGAGADQIAKLFDIKPVTEPEAILASFNKYEPEINHIIEIGAQTQKYLSVGLDKNSKELFLDEIIPGGKCAGGTGSFIEYMHKRLKYNSLEDFVQTGLKVQEPAGISGRCAVFAESDIVHHYQKGTPKERIVAGIHQAAARNYKALIHKGKTPTGKIAFIGGLSQNRCLKKHLIKELGITESQLHIPEHNLHSGAVGAALVAQKTIDLEKILAILEDQINVPFKYESTEPIKLEESIIMEPPSEKVDQKEIELAAIGIDIGSVSTKAALITKDNNEYKVLASFYRRTEGNPIEAVKDTLNNIYQQIQQKGFKIDKIVASTTGSGRYLTGYFVGADKIIDEITAQANGTSTYIPEDEVTIIEIGGQDSKFLQLERGGVVDFEMNWACAAGTGALIEKHAKNLEIDIKDFGDYALKEENPPVINSTCAVFAESALLYYQQNNVSLENLCAGACLASARNYLVKVARSRKISDTVVFQGAVAFNKGMIGSFETLLKRPIIVPPYPHLTGSIGCARLAYQEFENKSELSNFRGFKQISEANYKLTSFQCKYCPNECNVNCFSVGKEKFFQGDRCDKYSSAHKKNQGQHLPDLFGEYEDLLCNVYSGRDQRSYGVYSKKPILSDKKIGIPRGLLFNDYFPLFKAFFTELGLEVVTTAPTNKKITEKGIEKVLAEPCFPVKVAHGHVAELLEQDLDYIFLPAIHTAESSIGGYSFCYTCPYIQAAPQVISTACPSNGRTKYLTPSISLNYGYPHLRRVLTKVGRQLGKKSSQIKRALEVASEVFKDFRQRVKTRGRQILDNLKLDDLAFVVIGRPYAVYDPALNMDIAKKITDEGYLAIPLDYLPIEEYETSESWPNIGPFQGQKKLSCAKFLAKKKNLHGLVVTYFGCGPDAFLDQMFKEEIQRQYLTIQIDEHTSDTGILTRIQAYLNSTKTSKVESQYKSIKVFDTPICDIKEKQKILWIPYMSEEAKVFAALLRAHKINAKVLPLSDDRNLTLARNYICGDVCTPMLYTTEYMLNRAKQSDFSPQKEAFFQGKSGGPCRFGFYFILEKYILDSLYKDVDIVTLGNVNTHGGLGTFFLMNVWDALAAYDMLEKMLFHTRPYEVNKGEAQKIFLKYVDKLCKVVESKDFLIEKFSEKIKVLLGRHLKSLIDLLTQAQLEFSKIEKIKIKKPLIGIVGEFFVRLHEPANQFIIRRIEALGGEVWLAPATEFFGYSNYITGIHSYYRWRDTKDKKYLAESISKSFLAKLAHREERKLFEATLPYMQAFEEISPQEVVKLGSKYVSEFFGGEAILSMGKSEDFALKGLDGIISVGPFNCMPSMIVSALSHHFRKKHNNIPFLNIDFDGFEDSARDQRIDMFFAQVKQRYKNKVKAKS